jgi:hypothetical protein
MIYKAPLDKEAVFFFPVLIIVATSISYLVVGSIMLSIMIFSISLLVYLFNLYSFNFRSKDIELNYLIPFMSKTVDYSELKQICIHYKGETLYARALIILSLINGKTKKIKLQKKEGLHDLLRYLILKGVRVKIESPFKEIKEEYSEFI